MGIHDTMQELERLRRKRQGAQYVVLAIFILFFVMWFSILSQPNSTKFLFAPFLFGILIFFLLRQLSACQKEFDRLYKETFVPNVLQQYFQNLVYIGDHGFAREEVKQFGLARLGNIFQSEDLIRGQYRGINFAQSDVTIRHKSGGKNKQTTTYFKGRMFVFDFPKNEVISLQVHSKNFLFHAGSPGSFKLQKVEMEDVDFNKRFVVASVSAHDAFYILTPPLLIRIKAICERYGNVAMHFSCGKLYVGINTRSNAFDANMQKPLSYPEEQARIHRDAQVIIDIIDTMTDTFYKEGSL